MHFKHPEILYFLFLLVIPIIVHLFQLRRFKKQYFTNVKLLKQLQQESRKSKSIKKWLLLATRLLLLACLIFAFAQPFFLAKDTENKANELVIFLDNSFSMQAKGNKGELLKRSLQDILSAFPENQSFSLLTNDNSLWNIDSKSAQKEIQKIDYTSIPFKSEYFFSRVQLKKPNIPIDYVIISDANTSELSENKPIENKNTYFLEQKAINKKNISIESVSLNQVLESFYEIKVTLKAYETFNEEIPVSVFNENEVVAKFLTKFDKPEKEIVFNIPKKIFNGKVSISDNGLSYDNDFYFSIDAPKLAKITIIGEESKNNFIKKIATQDEFTVTYSTLAQLNYNSISEQQTIVLNEVEEIPQALITTLQSFYKNGGSIVFIPSEKSAITNINNFLKIFGNIQFLKKNTAEKLISKISFNHPLFKNVFEKKVTNFQSPKVTESFAITEKGLPILQFEDNASFLTSMTNKVGNVYIFTAPINKGNSNFQNAPLIVPTFYKMLLANENANLNSFTIGVNENTFLEATLSKDEVIKVANKEFSFIPSQQILPNKVKLSFNEYPSQSGNYTISQKEIELKKIGFNFPRTESNLNNINTSIYKNCETISDLESFLNDIQYNRNDTSIWKLFLWAALLFFLLELLIQKFVK